MRCGAAEAKPKNHTGFSTYPKPRWLIHAPGSQQGQQEQGDATRPTAPELSASEPRSGTVTSSRFYGMV